LILRRHLHKDEKYLFWPQPCVHGRVVAAGAKACEHYADGDRINFLAAKIPEGYEGNWMCGDRPQILSLNPGGRSGKTSNFQTIHE
jgi:hypothetical protein